MKLKTQILPATDAEAIQYAASVLRGGGLVAIPTETVYGLAANAFDADATARIFQVKGRPSDNPLIVHISAYEQLLPLVSELPENAETLARLFWPGPLTIVLPRSDAVPDIVSAGLDTVAVRLPSHTAARTLIGTAGVPIAAPSANLSGRPSPTAAAHCFRDLNGRVPLILDGGPCMVGIESTVITLAAPVPRLLRPGAVTHRQLENAIGNVEIDPAVLEGLPENSRASSPGMKYVHYSPKARVVLLKGEWENCRVFLEGRIGKGVWGLVFEEELSECPVPALSLGSKLDAQTQARRLFAVLRELDEKGAALIYARAPKNESVGLAVYNRLIRAAGFSVVNL